MRTQLSIEEFFAFGVRDSRRVMGLAFFGLLAGYGFGYPGVEALPVFGGANCNTTRMRPANTSPTTRLQRIGRGCWG